MSYVIKTVQYLFFKHFFDLKIPLKPGINVGEREARRPDGVLIGEYIVANILLVRKDTASLDGDIEILTGHLNREIARAPDVHRHIIRWLNRWRTGGWAGDRCSAERATANRVCNGRRF